MRLREDRPGWLKQTRTTTYRRGGPGYPGPPLMFPTIRYQTKVVTFWRVASLWNQQPMRTHGSCSVPRRIDVVGTSPSPRPWGNASRNTSTVICHGTRVCSFSAHVVADRYGHLYPSDTERVQDAFDAVFASGVVASNTPSVESEADQMQTGA
jgi:hypothetical protein